MKGLHKMSCSQNTPKPPIGGQALLEGVMMKGRDKYAVAVRKPDGTIDVQVNKTKVRKISKVPFIRGVVNFIDALLVGYKCLMHSAEVSMGDAFVDDSSKFDKWLEKKLGSKADGIVMGIAGVLGAVLAITLFMILPTFIVGLVDNFLPLGGFKTLLEGVIKIAIFLAYIIAVSKMKDIYRTFCYHGAEHKTIACYEADEDLTVENVKKHTRFHPRCGTSFLLIVMVVSILLFSVLPWTSTLVRAGLKIILLPLVMGISYEIIRFAGKHNNVFTRAISAPGMWLQRFTTYEPKDDMIEVAIASVIAILPPEEAEKYKVVEEIPTTEETPIIEEEQAPTEDVQQSEIQLETEDK